ncbi:MAG: DUF3293 domain-containing protein [Sulfurimonadaceae bacterium]
MPDYAKIYFHNSYEIALSSNTTYTFSLQHFKDNPLFDRPFAIITAFNPHNNTMSYQENLSRNQKLYNELNSKYELLEAKGCYEGHCEEGYLIFDISLSEAVELGRRYEQFTIFYNSVTALKYISCEDERIIVEKER